MAKRVLLAEYLSLNGTDVSSYTKKAELKIEADAVDITTFGDGGWSAFLAGLKSGELSWESLNDVAAAALDSIMWPLFGTLITFEIRTENTVVGASNPKYTGTVLCKEWSPIGGGIGDANSVSVSYPTSGVITRAVA